MAVNFKNNKKVSVVMCTYNGAKYIREQLDSILQQTYPIDEVIIRDDRSTDETIDILHAYMNQYSQIRLFVNEKRLGAHPNFMRALQDATGDFIAISDQDDIWELTKIERQMDCIGDHTLCFSLSQAFGDGVEADPECRVPNSNVLRMLFYPTIPGHAMLFRKEILSIIPNTDYIVYDLLIPLASDIYTNGGGYNRMS